MLICYDIIGVFEIDKQLLEEIDVDVLRIADCINFSPITCREDKTLGKKLSKFCKKRLDLGFTQVQPLADGDWCRIMIYSESE